MILNQLTDCLPSNLRQDVPLLPLLVANNHLDSLLGAVLGEPGFQVVKQSVAVRVGLDTRGGDVR